MKMIYILIIAMLAIPFVSAIPISNNIEKKWSNIITEDTNKEINATITTINKTTFEITLYDHPDSTTKNGYKWNAALCNTGGMNNPKVAQEDNQGGFEFSTYTDLPYDELINFGMDSSWCNETGGFGYPLFSSTSKNQLPKKFRIQVNDQAESFRIFGGTGSVIIDSSSTSTATAVSSTRNICVDINGGIHAAWDDTDVRHSKSTDGGVIWSTPGQVSASIPDDVGIECMDNGSIFVYWYDSGVSASVQYSQSTDFGVTWDTQVTFIDTGSIMDLPSCEGDLNSVLHCCVIDNSADNLHYINNSENVLEEPNPSTTDDSDYCMISIDGDNVPYIVTVGSDGDDVDLFSPSLGSWTTRQSVYEDSSFGNGEYPTIGISSDGKMGVCIVDNSDNDGYFCQSTIDDPTDWSCTELANGVTYYHPHTIITPANQVHCLFADTVSPSSGSDIFSYNSSDWSTWEARGDIGDGTYESGIAEDGRVHIITTHTSDDVTYWNYSVKLKPIYNLDVDYPTTSNQLTITSGSDETIGFKIYKDGVEQITGVTLNNITFDDTIVEIRNNTQAQDVIVTYDFSDETGLSARSDGTGIGPPPSNSNPPTTGTDRTSNSALDFEDGSEVSHSCGNNGNCYFWFNMTITDNQADINDVTWYWDGSGTATGTWYLYYWNTSDNSWDQCATAAIANLQCTLEGINDITSSNKDYYLLAFWDIGGIFQSLRTDYVSLNVSKTQDIAVKEFGYNGTSWVANITTLTLADGTYDFFVNATIDNEVINETQLSSVVYGTDAGECYETSPLTANCLIDCSTNPTLTTDINAAGFNINTYNTGTITMNSQFANFGEFANHNNLCIFACHNPSGCFG